MRYVIWLHKYQTIRRQRCCWAIPNLLLYIQTSICVPVPKACDAEEQTSCVPVTPSNTLCQPERNGKSPPKHRFCQRTDTGSALKWTEFKKPTTGLQPRGWVCVPKSEITNSYNHTIEANKQLITTTMCWGWSKMYFSISCPAHVLQEAVKATTFLHSGQVSNVMSKAPSTDLEHVVLLTPAQRVNPPSPANAGNLTCLNP